MSTPVQKVSTSLLGRLRFPQLFLLFGALFVADVLFPDFVPFIDEIILGMLTMMTAMWQRERPSAEGAEKPPEKNITPKG